jgi:hypothetical protein
MQGAATFNTVLNAALSRFAAQHRECIQQQCSRGVLLHKAMYMLLYREGAAVLARSSALA